MNPLKYKDYLGSVEYDLDGGYLHGKILLIDDCIIYDGQTVDELKTAFENAVDEYLAFCQEIGKSPNKSYSGTFNIRIPPELHKAYSKQAILSGTNLNALITKALMQYQTVMS